MKSSATTAVCNAQVKVWYFLTNPFFNITMPYVMLLKGHHVRISKTFIKILYHHALYILFTSKCILIYIFTFTICIEMHFTYIIAFTFCKKLGPMRKTSIPIKVRKNEEIITNEKEVLNTWKEDFEKLYNCPVNQDDEFHNEIKRKKEQNLK